MAAYINRTISLMPGEGPSSRGGALVSNGDSRVSNSPLQIFVTAKKKINDIFIEVEDYVKDTVQYMHGKHNSVNIKICIIRLNGRQISIYGFRIKKGAGNCFR